MSVSESYFSDKDNHNKVAHIKIMSYRLYDKHKVVWCSACFSAIIHSSAEFNSVYQTSASAFWYHCYIVCNTGINIGLFFSLNILTKYPDFDSHSFPNSTTCIVGVNAIYFEKWIIYTAKKSEHRYYENLFIQGMFLRIVSLILRLLSWRLPSFMPSLPTDCIYR